MYPLLQLLSISIYLQNLGDIYVWPIQSTPPASFVIYHKELVILITEWVISSIIIVSSIIIDSNNDISDSIIFLVSVTVLCYGKQLHTNNNRLFFVY